MYVEEVDSTTKKICLVYVQWKALGNLAANEGSSITKV